MVGSGALHTKILLAFSGTSCAISLALNRRASAAVRYQQVWNAGAQQRSNKDEKIKRSTVGFLAGNHVCDRIFGAS
jgi:hypothetical protein